MRLGGMETIKVDVRIIAATNVDLRQMMEEGSSARICSTASTSSRSSCRRCAIARTTSRCSSQHFLDKLRRGEPQDRTSS